jgi:hypothetical protein
MQSMRAALWAGIALAMSAPVAAAYTWNNVTIGAGGYVPGIQFHPASKGLAYIRTDVGGAYRLDATTRTSWTPINDMFNDGNDMGSIAVGIDETDTNYVYLTGGLYTNVAWCGGASFFRSANRGATWTKIALDSTVKGTNSSKLNGKKSVCLGGNGEGRGMGNRIAAKGTTIYLGTNQNGLLKSTDRGTTWSTVAAFGDTTGIGAVAFDAAGSIYVAPYLGGIWKSTNGTTWTQLPGFTGAVFQMSYNKTSNAFWLTTNAVKPLDQGTAGSGSVWTLNATTGSFTQVAMPAKGEKDIGYGGISVNPNNPRQVVVATNGWWKGKDSPLSPATFVPHEAIYMTTDSGTTWKDILAAGSFDAASAANAASNNPHWISALAIDPNDSNHVLFGTGYGMWGTFNATSAQPTWTFDDKGIEETAVLAMVSSKVGAPLVSAIGDIDGFYHESLTKAPTARHQVEAGTNYDISMAGQAPTKMIRIHKETKFGLGGWSEDAGKTWTSFASYPPFVASQWSETYTNEMNYAALSADGSSIVWNMQKHGVYFSKDKGTTWTASSTAASLLASDTTSYRVVADQVTAGTFYIYNGGTGILYRSTNHGANWSVMNDTLEFGGSWASGYFRTFASPKKAGEIWLTQGIHIYNCFGQSWCGWPSYNGGGLWVGDKGEANVVLRSVDGGKTVTPVKGLLSATSIGFGKGKTDAIPAIYALGMNSAGVSGLFRSTDDAATWTRIDDSTKQFGGFSLVIGDPCVYSRVYLTTNGRGIAYGEEGTNANNCSERVDGIGYTSIAAKALAKSALTRVGTSIRSTGTAPLRLLDLQGRVLRRSAEDVPGTLTLSRLPSGLYLATDGSNSLPVAITE